MTSSNLGKQLTLDLLATPALGSGSEERAVPTALFGTITQPGLALWNPTAIRPAREPKSAPPTGKPPESEATPQPATPITAAIEPEPPRNQHNYRITGEALAG